MQNSATKISPGLAVREHFPIFTGKKMHYLDSGASTQKPSVVIDRIKDYLSNEHSNIHRGAYHLSAEATLNYDNAKSKIAGFIGAKSQKNLIFTRGTTEGVNLAASAYQHNLKEGDSILITMLEHHSNIVPWQQLARRKKLNLLYTEISQDAEIDLDDYLSKIRKHKPKIVSFVHIANAIGTVLPVEHLIAEAKKENAIVFLDAAQSVQHKKINVQELAVDFMAFSGHKIYGPTGIGVLYVKPEVAGMLEPYQTGGDMISNVSLEGSEWADFPQKFEAGTPAIAEAIGLGTAIDFINQIGINEIAAYEEKLFIQAFDLLSKVPKLKLYGPAVKYGPDSGLQSSIISFNLDGIHAHDLSTVADSFNVQIRAGHHCAMPALKRLGIPSSARASIGVYSDISDFEALVEGLMHAAKMFA